MNTEELNISDFNRIEARRGIEVEVVKADSYGVSLSLQNIKLKDVKVEKEGSKLIIRRGINLREVIMALAIQVKARITMPELLELSLSGASHGTIQGFSSAGDLTLNIEGASYLDMADISAGTVRVKLSGASRLTGQLTAGDTELKLSGASNVKLNGSVRDILIDASGASRLELYGLQARNANAKLTGASSGQLKMNGRLDVRLSGASKLSHTGPTTLGEVSISGASSLSSE